LTRFFELARQQTPAGARGEPPRAEPPPSATTVDVELPRIEEPVSAVPPEPEPNGTASEPSSIELPLATEPVDIPERTREPPSAYAQSVPAPNTDTPVVTQLSPKMPEPLKAARASMEETPAVLETPPARSEETEPSLIPPAATAEPASTPLELRHVVDAAPARETTSAVGSLPAEPLRAPAPMALPPPTFKELTDYWRSLRNGDDHPAVEAVDRALVTTRWPGTLLIAYTPASEDPRGEPRPGRVTRLG